MTDTAPDFEPKDEQSDAQRAASVTLRAESDGRDDQLETANQSLRDALRITYKLLQLGIFVVVLLYLFSSAQAIRESERGVATVFGRIVETDLEPGLRLSFPYPIGELIRVRTGSKVIQESQAFWPESGRAGDSIENLPIRNQLDPATDGSHITADGNIAHTRWNIVYTRSEPSRFITNILPNDEEPIVHSIVRRAIIATIAGVTIEELLKSTTDDGSTVAARARRAAQIELDRLGSGLRIEQLTLEDRIPPATLRRAFNEVQSAQSRANKAIEDARTISAETLRSVAGLGAERLFGLIEQYESAIESDDGEAAEELLALIHGLMDGSIDQDASERVTGEVTVIMNDARRYRTEVVRTRRGQRDLFLAKLEQFEQNPLLTIFSSWDDAYGRFVQRDSVQQMLLPPSTDVIRLVINQDPSIRKELEKARKLMDALNAREQAGRDRERARYRTETGQRVEQ